MRIIELLILHFGIAASMAAGFALLPLFCAAVVRVLRRPPRPAHFAISASRYVPFSRRACSTSLRRSADAPGEPGG